MTCESNEHYGHGETLRRYCGVDRRRIRGRIQHGWSAKRGVVYDRLVKAGEPVYLWTESDYEAGAWVGEEQHSLMAGQGYVIGSPFLYLEPYKRERHPGRSAEILAFPYHSLSHRAHRPGAFSAYAEWLVAYAKSLNLRPAICLHQHDMAASGVFSKCGIRIETCGKMEDPRFLRNCRDLITRVQLVTSNVVCTSIFYALYSGTSIKVGGPMMRHTEFKPQELPDFSAEELVGSEAWTEKHYPELSGGICSDRSLGERELGAKHKASPKTLAELLF